MQKDQPKKSENKSTKIDTFKSFSHERPDPKTNPPVIQPIQLQSPKEPPMPEPKPSNSDSDN